MRFLHYTDIAGRPYILRWFHISGMIGEDGGLIRVYVSIDGNKTSFVTDRAVVDLETELETARQSDDWSGA